MDCTDPDEAPDKEATGDSSATTNNKTLSCPFCDDANFPSVSKLNKHRNLHLKPYRCFADGCFRCFGQQQALDRHRQTEHKAGNNPSKYFHCTVDGCKYASTGPKQKFFARLDQAKEHIKDYGHYGPQSANDRPKRPGDPLSEVCEITARIEEWSLDESPPRRSIQLCVFKSSKTKKLWHADETGDLFLKKDSSNDNSVGYGCPVPGCYFQSQPPEGCGVTLFKTEKGRWEHICRAHGDPAMRSWSLTQPQAKKGYNDFISLGSTESSNYSSTDIALTSDMQGLNILLNRDCQASFSYATAKNFGGQGLSPLHTFAEETPPSAFGATPCINYVETPYPLAGNSFSPPDPITESLQPTCEFPLHTNSPNSSTFYDTFSQNSMNSEDSMEYSYSSSCTNALSLIRSNSSKSYRSRLNCPYTGCMKSFPRKYELQRHVATIHNPILYSCCHCRRLFRRKDKLNEHLRNVQCSSRDSQSVNQNFHLHDILRDDFLASPPDMPEALSDAFVNPSYSITEWVGETQCQQQQPFRDVAIRY